jgi:hypothetical protein
MQTVLPRPGVPRYQTAPRPLTAPAAAPNQVDCTHGFGNASFSLLPLMSTVYYPVWDDRNNRGSLNYTYYFNVCKNIDPLYFNKWSDCEFTQPGPGGRE